MIWDSAYWKQDLERLAAFLRERQRPGRRWTAASDAQVEKRVFLGAYSIRKLIEAEKLTDACRDLQLKVTAYPATGKAITRLNWHRSEENFDLKSGKDQSVHLQWLMNQFIHSYVFHLVLDEKTKALRGFLIASDRQKGTSLLQLDAAEFQRACKTVARDNVVAEVAVWCPKAKRSVSKRYGPGEYPPSSLELD